MIKSENEITLKDVLVGIIVLVVVIAAVCGSYVLARKVNYSLFYEDMVQETVREMVKKKCLNDTMEK